VGVACEAISFSFCWISVNPNIVLTNRTDGELYKSVLEEYGDSKSICR
jgi:hypothetical protein